MLLKDLIEQAIQESSDLSVSELLKRPGRVELFLNKVRSEQPFELKDGGTFTVDPNLYDSIKDFLKPGAKGSLIVTDVAGNKISTTKFKKTADFGGLAGKEGKVSNKGEVIEGILGAATMARLLQRPGQSISPEDVHSVIKALPNTKDGGKITRTVPEGESITDSISLTVKLKPATYSDFKNEQKWPILTGYTNSVVAYVNDAVNRYATFFETNGRPDRIDVVSDGVSDETGTKTDVYMIYIDANGERRLQHFDLSAKSGTTKQIGQVGGGRQTAALEERFQLLKDMWLRFGVDVGIMEKEFISSNSIEEGYAKVYSLAAKILQEKLAGAREDVELNFLKTLVNGIKYFATLNDDRIKLVQFTKTGFYVLDFKKLDRLYDNQEIDLTAEYVVGGAESGDSLPKVVILDKASGDKFLSIRMYRTAGGYIRNYIEKEKGLVKLTKVRGNK